MPKKFRVGFIGTGGIARTTANAFKEIPDVELVAACDINEDVLSRFAQDYGIPNAFTDYKKMVALKEMGSRPV